MRKLFYEKRFKEIRDYLSGRVLGFTSDKDAIELIQRVREEVLELCAVDIIQIAALIQTLFLRGAVVQDLTGGSVRVANTFMFSGKARERANGKHTELAFWTDGVMLSSDNDMCCAYPLTEGKTYRVIIQELTEEN